VYFVGVVSGMCQQHCTDFEYEDLQTIKVKVQLQTRGAVEAQR